MRCSGRTTYICVAHSVSELRQRVGRGCRAPHSQKQNGEWKASHRGPAPRVAFESASARSSQAVSPRETRCTPVEGSEHRIVEWVLRANTINERRTEKMLTLELVF